jgi:putative cardiolipin synthase
MAMSHLTTNGLPQLRCWKLIVLTVLITGCSPLRPDDTPPEYTPAPANAAIWEALLAERQGDWFAPLNEGTVALDWRLRAIDSAVDSIDLQTFLWTFDTAGALVLDHLVAAADRGVRVKLLIDDSFVLGKDQVLLAIHRHRNMEYRIYNPYKRRVDSLVTRAVLNLSEFHRLDHRMHNKAMIIDNRVAIVGGRNLADEYFGLHAAANFRDLEVIAGGPIVLQVSEAFDRYWNDRWSVPIDSLAHVKPSPVDLDAARDAGEKNLHIHSEEPATDRLSRWLDLVADACDGQATLFVDQPPEGNPASPEEAPVQVANDLVDVLDAATSEILIISAYLIPTTELELAIERAVERGVRVRMLTNSIGSNNHITAHSAYRNHIKQMLSDGAELHEVKIDAHDRGIYMLAPVEQKILALHAKALVIDDDQVFIGSANLDPRSLRINTEMGLLIRSKSLNAQLREAVDPDFNQTNAWQLQLADNGSVLWVSDDVTLTSQPALSFMQRIEDWLFAHLPLEDEL